MRMETRFLSEHHMEDAQCAPLHYCEIGVFANVGAAIGRPHASNKTKKLPAQRRITLSQIGISLSIAKSGFHQSLKPVQRIMFIYAVGDHGYDRSL